MYDLWVCSEVSANIEPPTVKWIVCTITVIVLCIYFSTTRRNQCPLSWSHSHSTTELLQITTSGSYQPMNEIVKLKSCCVKYYGCSWQTLASRVRTKIATSGASELPIWEVGGRSPAFSHLRWIATAEHNTTDILKILKETWWVAVYLCIKDISWWFWRTLSCLGWIRNSAEGWMLDFWLGWRWRQITTLWMLLL